MFSFVKRVTVPVSRRLCRNRNTTAGIIVIGDEILKGQVLDTNSGFIAKELYQLGICLRKISVVGDNLKELSKEVQIFSNCYDYVITTGGIGPTHDDITYEAVALAFDEPLVMNDHLRDLCSKFYRVNDDKAPGMKLAWVPKSAKLNYNKNKQMSFPQVSIKNVFMFPGIPELLIKSFSNMKEVLFLSNQTFYSKCLYFNVHEDKIVQYLEILVKEFPQVQFGSYPKLYDESYKVKITIESCDEEEMARARQRFLELVPKEYLVTMDDK